MIGDGAAVAGTGTATAALRSLIGSSTTAYWWVGGQLISSYPTAHYTHVWGAAVVGASLLCMYIKILPHTRTHTHRHTDTKTNLVLTLTAFILWLSSVHTCSGSIAHFRNFSHAYFLPQYISLHSLSCSCSLSLPALTRTEGALHNHTGWCWKRGHIGLAPAPSNDVSAAAANVG